MCRKGGAKDKANAAASGRGPVLETGRAGFGRTDDALAWRA
jgi:hypothetical protein